MASHSVSERLGGAAGGQAGRQTLRPWELWATPERPYAKQKRLHANTFTPSFTLTLTLISHFDNERVS